MFLQVLDLAAGFISTKKVYTFSSIRGHIIPESAKCAHSATKMTKASKRQDSGSRAWSIGLRGLDFEAWGLESRAQGLDSTLAYSRGLWFKI